jgi:predicted ATPase
VADKRLLLLLDNIEHLIEAANDLAGLHAACPNLQLLVTSRELLGLPGEQAYPVPPLEPEDGTQLFLARARAVKPSFEPDDSVPELCARLDNSRSRSSWPLPACASSLRRSCSSACRIGSTCSRPAAASTRASRRSGPRSSGHTGC